MLKIGVFSSMEYLDLSPVPVNDSGWDPRSKQMRESWWWLFCILGRGTTQRKLHFQTKHQETERAVENFRGHHGSPHPFVIFLGLGIPTKKPSFATGILGGGVDPTYEQLPAVARLCPITCCLRFSSFFFVCFWVFFFSQHKWIQKQTYSSIWRKISRNKQVIFCSVFTTNQVWKPSIWVRIWKEKHTPSHTHFGRFLRSGTQSRCA